MSFVILDRDGVINHDSDDYIKSPAEWEAIPGSLDAIAKLNRHGYDILIATNQSGVSRGLYDLDTLDLIHEKMVAELAAVGGFVREIFFCPHHPDAQCACRKPKVGLLQQMATKYPIHFAETYFIGDSQVDVLAARAVGCMPLLVLTGKGKRVLEKYPELATVPTFPDLAAAVEYILKQRDV
jgi:D-glycero-D-manno-heptose 1,7-bisphosphate phosphatase